MTYERFTDRARKCLQLANQEARRLDHPWLGTEHLLLGIVKEGSGVAAHVLKNLGVELDAIRTEAEKIIQVLPLSASRYDFAYTKLPQTQDVRRVIEEAIKISSSLCHNYVGTEHLLLGLLSGTVPPNAAKSVLVGLGLTIDRVREEVLFLLGPQQEKAVYRPAHEGPTMVWSASFPEDVKQELLELAEAAKKADALMLANAVSDAVLDVERRRTAAILDAWISKYKKSPRPEVAAVLMQVKKEIERGVDEAKPE